MKEIVVVTPFSSMSEVTRRVVSGNAYSNVDLLEAEPGNFLERTRLAIDSGAKVPETVIESELFGYVEGSFTGAANKCKAGLFEMTHGVTLLRDL